MPYLKPQDTGDRLSRLRTLMSDRKLDVYLVPETDAHGSEWLAVDDRRQTFISNFTGEAATALITHDRAYLFADGRFHDQAAEELDSHWTLQKVGVSGVLDWDAYLAKLDEGTRVGYDPTLLSYSSRQSLQRRLAGVCLVAIKQNLIDTVWGDEKPSPSRNALYIQDQSFSGEAASEKLQRLRSAVTTLSSVASAYIISDLASIAWLLNLRGSDIPYNPFFKAYLLIGADEASDKDQEKGATADRSVLFVPFGQIWRNGVRQHLEKLRIETREYDDVWDTLSSWYWARKKCLTVGSISAALADSIGENNLEVVSTCPVVEMKAVKNPVELGGFRQCYLQDAVAFVRGLAWLERQIRSGRKVSEYEAGEQFFAFREGLPQYVGPSYEMISATGANAAMPHYAPSADGSAIIDTKTPYLNDTGGQYRNGTTDTTRTVHFGKPTKEQKRVCTKVLQGHIAIDMAVFPEGTTGYQLDILARKALWSDGLDYLHGTGHGFGSFLGVHEGPQRIGGGSVAMSTPLVPGHVVTNEPGCYLSGDFGVRYESALAVREMKVPYAKGSKKYLGFERFTQVPISLELVDFSLLSEQELRWLVRHNKECFGKLRPLLRKEGDKLALAYAKKQTKLGLKARLRLLLAK